MENFKKSGSSAGNALKFFSRILRSEALVYNNFFFQNSCLTEIMYLTLDSHTNTVKFPGANGLNKNVK